MLVQTHVGIHSWLQWTTVLWLYSLLIHEHSR